MGSLRRPDFEHWKSLINLVIFAVILLAAETTTSPISSRWGKRWQQTNQHPFLISKPITRSQSLLKLRSQLAQKRQTVPSSHQTLAESAHPEVRLNLRAITLLSKLLESANDESSPLSSYSPSSFSLSAAESSGNLPSFSDDIDKRQFFNDKVDSATNVFLPYNVELESYSSPQDDRSSEPSSSPSLSSSQKVIKRRWYPYRHFNGGRTYYKRVQPCYLNVVTCY